MVMPCSMEEVDVVDAEVAEEGIEEEEDGVAMDEVDALARAFRRLDAMVFPTTASNRSIHGLRYY